jgi:hypothetical protein
MVRHAGGMHAAQNGPLPQRLTIARDRTESDLRHRTVVDRISPRAVGADSADCVTRLNGRSGILVEHRECSMARVVGLCLHQASQLAACLAKGLSAWRESASAECQMSAQSRRDDLAQL